VAEKLFLSCWPAQAPRGRAIVFADGGTARPSQSTIDSVRAGLAREFGLADRQVVETARLREIGMEVFDRTFAITRALNLLTLLVGGIGIFCAVSAIHHHRLGTQALLAALGLSRSERGWLLAAQWGLLGLLCMIIVWPFGTALAWLLAELVTPRAFGWSFPLVLEWGHYPRLALTACVALLLAAMLPAMRLLNASPADLFRGRVH
jgi:putative ABC transport system permease protein